MPRLTKKLENGRYTADESVYQVESGKITGELVEKLAVLENLCDELVAEQQELSEKLQEMRISGRTSHYRYKEMMGKKLVNSSVISLFESHGLELPASK